jgi:hypothetical protein
VLSNYDEIKTFLPGCLESIQDVVAYLKALGNQLDALDTGVLQARDNNFIFLADEATISRVEKFMYIPYDPARTLDDRRKLIASFFVGSGKIGANEIKQIVNTFTPSPTDVTFQNSTINIRVTRDISDSFILADCYFVLLKKIPAHLSLVITVISAFEVNAYAGGFLTQYKEEVVA